MDFLYSHQISNRIDPIENRIARESFFIDGSPVYQSKKKHQNEKLELEIPFPGHMFPEIVAIVFSIACFIAICSVLFAYDQHSRPELHYGLTLNAIISVLATACKSSLIFVIGEAMGQLKWTWFYGNPNKLLDIQTLYSASRGPLGSIVTLFQKTRRSFASFGAAVIILLLAFDPFVQQIISYPTRFAAIQGDVLKIHPHSGLWGIQATLINLTTPRRLNHFAPSIDYNLVYPSGFWSEEAMSSPGCLTGNCTWPKFQSNGMCSQCSDITESMDLTCKKAGNFSVPFANSNQTYQMVNVTCHLAPPQGASTQFNLKFQFSSAPSWSSYEPKVLSWHVFLAYSQSIYRGNSLYEFHPHPNNLPFTWPGDPLMIVGYAEIGYNNDYWDSDFIRGIRVDKATQCSLELCLLEYDASVENGAPNVTTSVLDYGQLFWRNSSFTPWKGQTLCWRPTTGPPDITIDDPINNDTFVQLSPTEFAFCGVTSILLLEDVLVGSMSLGQYSDSGGFDDLTKADLKKAVGDPNTIRIASSGLEYIMSNVARHFTNEALWRNGSAVDGTTYFIEVFVKVQWLWLILPSVLVVSGTIFIGIVMMRNRKNGMSLWKSSVLAFIYHELHDVDKDDSMAASVMEKKAEELVVRLQACDDHGGLILQEKKN